MQWSAELRKAIEAEMEYHQIEGDKRGEAFVGEWRLRRAWGQLQSSPHHYGLDPVDPVWELLPYILDSNSPIVKVASILVLIKWEAWAKFSSIFVDIPGRRDNSLPFGIEALGSHNFLGPECAHLFSQMQLSFLAITIKEGQHLEFSTHFRLPFNNESRECREGSFGAVTKVKVARHYFQNIDGELNYERERVLACKRLHHSDDFAKEVENLEVIRRNAQQHNHIMVHLATVAVGASFNIFYLWAHQDLRQLLYESDLEEPERLPKRLLKEAGNLANAVSFLHTNIKDDGRHVKFFHMDLKPENILVVEQANDLIGRWMIADFGISTVHDDLAGSKTTAKRRRGAFQPPEIDESWVEHERGVDEKGDIWALGCILCMVLAFIVGGKEAVAQLQHSRRYDELRRQEQDFFYVLEGEPGSKTMMLKKTVDDWLTHIEKAKPLDWVREYTELIRSTLQINQKLRPSAAEIDKRLDAISRMSIGQLTRNMTQTSLEFNAVKPASQPKPRKQRPASLTNSEATPGFGLREFVTGGGLSRFSLRRNTESGQQSRRGTISNEELDSPSPVPQPEEGLRHLITPTSPSSGSSGGLKFEEGGRFSLLGANQKHLVVDSCICPTADRIVLCLKNAAALYRRRHDTQYIWQHEWAGKWEHAYLAGPYLALQSVNNEATRLELIDADSDGSFATAVGADSQISLVLDLALSTRGVAALLFSNFVRIYASQRLVPEESFSGTMRAPYDYSLPDLMKNEKFVRAAFNAEGDRLIAIGSKHWFMWNLSIVSKRHVDKPEIGRLCPEQRHGESRPVIIPMKFSKAFLIYDDALESIRLFEEGDKRTQSQSCQMRCGIVGPQDDQLLYVRDIGKRNNRHYTLMRRIINVEVKGNSRSHTLGQEREACELGQLKYRKDAKLKMAFSQAHSSSSLIISSSDGCAVEVHLLYDEDPG